MVDRYNFLFPEVEQPDALLLRSPDHTQLGTHIHLVWFLCTNDQLVAKAAPYTTHNIHNRRISMPSAGFQLTIPAIERLQTHALDHMDTGIGSLSWNKFNFDRIPLQFCTSHCYWNLLSMHRELPFLKWWYKKTSHSCKSYKAFFHYISLSRRSI